MDYAANAIDARAVRHQVGSGLQAVAPPTISEVTHQLNVESLDLTDRISNGLQKLDMRLFGDRPREGIAVPGSEPQRFTPDGALGSNYGLAMQLRDRLAVIEALLSRLHSEI